jgi:glycolate oxidase iron-sulfur subunit
MSNECIQCGRCLAVCPLVSVTGREELSPRAKQLMKQLLENQKLDIREVPAQRLAGLCLACGRCREVCPYDLSGCLTIAGMKEAHSGFAERIWGQFVDKANTLWPLASTAVFAMPARLRLRKEREAPEPWFVLNPGSACAPFAKAVLFAGCTARLLRPSWAAKARGILEILGVELLPEKEFSCCGWTLRHAGTMKELNRARTDNVFAWRALGRPKMVTLCATCHAGLLQLADDRLAWYDGEQEEWRKSLVPLASLMGGMTFDALEASPETFLYHRPCHAPVRDGMDPDEALVAAMADEKLHMVSREHCCGLGGIMQLTNSDLCNEITIALWEYLAPEPGTALLSGCSGCVMRLENTAPEGVLVRHWLDAMHVK